MTPRRAVLSVPANGGTKIAKAMGAPVDEVVVDLEDSVPAAEKLHARAVIASLRARSGGLAVRVNAIGTPWFREDLSAAVANEAVDSVVLPKAASAGQIAVVARAAAEDEVCRRRPRPLQIQALIESPLGVANAREIATTSRRLTALILGYADLAASLGRSMDASWQFAQDAVLLAARVGGVQAVDGPLLSVHADDRLIAAAAAARDLGFDGKWVIHPRQIEAVQRCFTPTDDEVGDARELLRVLEAAELDGRGAVEWRGQMLDEAVAEQARRLLSRVPEASR